MPTPRPALRSPVCEPWDAPEPARLPRPATVHGANLLATPASATLVPEDSLSWLAEPLAPPEPPDAYLEGVAADASVDADWFGGMREATDHGSLSGDEAPVERRRGLPLWLLGLGIGTVVAAGSLSATLGALWVTGWLSLTGPTGGPIHAEPGWAELGRAEPVHADPVGAHPVRAEPIGAEPVRAEPAEPQLRASVAAPSPVIHSERPLARIGADVDAADVDAADVPVEPPPARVTPADRGPPPTATLRPIQVEASGP